MMILTETNLEKYNWHFLQWKDVNFKKINRVSDASGDDGQSSRSSLGGNAPKRRRSDEDSDESLEVKTIPFHLVFNFS